MSNDKEREAFEASQHINYPAASLHRSQGAVRLDNGEYLCAMTQIAWEAWQARASLASSRSEDAMFLAVERDELFQAAIDFIRTLTGMEPPPIEAAPPEVFAPFRAFVDTVQTITGKRRASLAASAPEPSGQIKEPYTLAEIKAKIASNDYSAELMLQHAMLHLDRLAASAGSEAVAPDQPSMPETWSVVAKVRGEPILSIGESWLSGKGELTDAETQAVVGMAQHLLAFVGYGLPPSNFDTDAQDAATHPSPPEGMEGWWRPIAEAPKDDTVVDIWRPSWGGERCPDMRRVDLGGGNVFYAPVLAGPACVRDATHFMIVRPPLAAGGGKEANHG